MSVLAFHCRGSANTMVVGCSGPARPCRSASDILFNRFPASVCNVCQYISLKLMPIPAEKRQYRSSPCWPWPWDLSCSVRRQTYYIRVDLLTTGSPILYYLVDIGRRLYGNRAFGTTRSQEKSLFIRMVIFLSILVIGGLYVFGGHTLCHGCF